MANKKSNKLSKKNQKQLASLITGIIVVVLVIIFGGANTGIFDGLGMTGSHSSPSSTIITDPAAFSMHVINIGQGDAILLSKDGKYALVDAGKSNQEGDIDSTAALTNYLDSLGVKKLEFLLITHQDYDHIGSAKTILSKYNVGTFYDNGFVHTSKTYEKLMTYIDENNIPYKVVYAGKTIPSPWNGVTIRVLSPDEELTYDVNENSVVLKITYGSVSYLLTGDATTAAEEYILSTGADVSADILKVGHHGSYSSSSDAFLKKVSPAVYAVSVGDGNEYGHPHKDALKRLIKYSDILYRTDIDGTIVISTDGKTYSVKTENGLANDPKREFVTGDGKKVSA
ncbi:MAG TPA: MBL fold metallo-hydrolase [Methanocorpusculum sp.]|nr:MBL fold metallo-hydrolase [Methanocorpusculum sp.]